MKAGEVVGEVRRLLWARPVQTALVGLLAAAIVVSVLATVGRTAALEQEIMARTETPEARVITIVDTGLGAAIRPEMVRVLSRMDGVERVFATTSPVDAVNFHLGVGSTPIPVWGVSGQVGDVASLRSGRLPQPGEAIVSHSALAEAGLDGPVGALLLGDGRDLPVVGTFDPMPPLAETQSGAVWLLPDQTQGLRRLHILASSLPRLDAVTARAVGLFDTASLGELRVERSAAVVELQRLLAGDLGRFGRELVAVVLLAGMLLVMLVLFAEVLSRRKDLGRQRALGARRSTVIMLLAARTAAAAALGSVLGLAVGLAYLSSIDELPALGFSLGLVLLSVFAPTLASVLPAWWAAQRDPVLELRTP